MQWGHRDNKRSSNAKKFRIELFLLRRVSWFYERLILSKLSVLYHKVLLGVNRIWCGGINFEYAK